MFWASSGIHFWLMFRAGVEGEVLMIDGLSWGGGVFAGEVNVAST